VGKGAVREGGAVSSRVQLRERHVYLRGLAVANGDLCRLQGRYRVNDATQHERGVHGRVLGRFGTTGLVVVERDLQFFEV
jgi:hypothetical protein